MRGSQSAVEEVHPTRFVMTVVEADEQWAWRVLVRRHDASKALALASAGKLIAEETVRGWFRQHAARWPDPPAGELMDAFVSALNALRVTRSRTVAALQTLTSRRAEIARQTTRIKAAINTLADELPPMLEAGSSKDTIPYSDSQMLTLVVLARAAQDARNIIVAPEPPHREQAWHDTAQLIEWHICQLLAQVGVSNAYDDAKGPLVRVIKAAIEEVEGLTVTGDAISKALQRAASTKVYIMTLESVASKGYTAIG